MARIALDLLAQAAHKNINRARRHERAFFPDRIKKLVAGEDASTMADEVFEEPELAHGRWHGFALHGHRHGGDIDFKLAQLNQFAEGSLFLGAKDVANASDQLARAERLGDIAVAAGIEGLEAIHLLGTSGEKNDWRLSELFVLPNLAAEVEAVHLGQHDIEKEQRGLSQRCRSYNRRAREKCRDIESRGAQVMFDEARHIEVVLDHVDEVGVTRTVGRLLGIHCRRRNQLFAVMR